METKRRLALMIDGDNAQATLIGPIMTAVSKYGEITIRPNMGKSPFVGFLAIGLPHIWQAGKRY